MASHEPVDGSPTRSSAPKNPNKRKKGGSEDGYFDVYGPDGTADVILKSPATKTMCQQDIQELVTWVLANGVMPSWIFVKNKPLIRKVVLLYLPGVDADLYRSNPKLFCGLRKYCGIPQQVSALSCVADEMQTIGALLACRLKRKNAEVNSNQLFHNSDFGKETALFLKNQELAFPVLYYTHSRSELEDNGYCLSHPDFKSTFPAPAGTAPYNIVALDCEMCVTAEGFELTRATLIDCSGEVVLDELVKPVNCIIDYNTRYSGITEEMLNGVTTTLEDIQEEFLKLVYKETILVGHSLENDLLALKISHDLIIDTAILYKNPRHYGRKTALRVLSQKFLSRQIQASGKGHDSIEDARAALELVLLKLRNGPQFGTNSSIVHKLVSVLQECGKTCSIVDDMPVIKRYSDDSCNSIPVFTDNDALSRTIKEVKKDKINFIWTRFSELYSLYKLQAQDLEKLRCKIARTISLHTCNKSSEVAMRHGILDIEVKDILMQMNERIEKLYNTLPENALFIICTGHGDTAIVQRLRRILRENHEPPLSRTEILQALEKLQVQAESALCFASVKHFT
ncbi:hypothetical protein HPP92_021131 [Vanilla planifolia]|uniref:Exonuclease domain-containing protein n=1 Tax=Vanilla planifolia TaxID=51239 RepID=A0A835UJ51_VANPL|nr:hypothetical protein HPP92_021131 [Vanilla planifolia]